MSLCLTIPTEYRPSIQSDWDALRVYISGKTDREFAQQLLRVALQLMVETREGARGIEDTQGSAPPPLH